MNFTFGIITYSQHHKQNNIPRINLLIDSIEKENIPNYEIIIVGDGNVDRKNTTIIEFDETIKSGWITKKKNIITQNARFENIIYMHDYMLFMPNWYKGWLKFGNDWDIGINVIMNSDETRFRDVIAWDNHTNFGPQVWYHKNMPSDPNETPFLVGPHLPPYTYTDFQYSYISGSYWIAKKYVMASEPLDERYVWGQSEDIDWSMRVRNKYKIVMNTYSAVKIQHWKDPVWKSINPYWMSNEYITKDLI